MPKTNSSEKKLITPIKHASLHTVGTNFTKQCSFSLITLDRTYLFSSVFENLPKWYFIFIKRQYFLQKFQYYTSSLKAHNRTMQGCFGIEIWHKSLSHFQRSALFCIRYWKMTDAAFVRVASYFFYNYLVLRKKIVQSNYVFQTPNGSIVLR